MGTVQFHKAGFYHLRRIIVSGNTDGLSCGTDRVHDQLHQFVKPLSVDLVILDQMAVLDIFQDDLPINLSGRPRIRSHPIRRLQLILIRI